MSALRTRAVLVEPTLGQVQIDRAEQQFQQLKAAIHEELVDSLDLTQIGAIGNDAGVRAEVLTVAEEICRDRALSLKGRERERMHKELLDEVFGLGPIEPLMQDPSVNDILVNGPHEVYVERYGQLELSNVIFADAAHVLRIVQRIVARVGRRIDEVSPMVDARLPDGSRVNAVVPPLAVDFPTLSIRKFRPEGFKVDDLIENRTLVSEMIDFLSASIEARISFLISGGTGAGKTTLLNSLSTFIPPAERIVTIEDSAELRLAHRHVVRMETRPPNTEERGQITQRDLVRNALRMRPDRIIVGEVRGAEALDMLQAMNTGHEGSLTTIHANDARDALARLEMMVAMTGFELPVNVTRQYIATGIRLIVHVSRLRGGARKIMRIAEILGVSADGQFETEEIFGFEQTGVNSEGVALGHFYATGYRPKCLERLRAAGIPLPDSMFNARRIAANPASGTPVGSILQ